MAYKLLFKREQMFDKKYTITHMPENLSLHFNKYIIHPKEIKGNSLVAEELLARILMASLSLGNGNALVGLNYYFKVQHMHLAAPYTRDEHILDFMYVLPLTVQNYVTLSIRLGFFSVQASLPLLTSSSGSKV